MPTNAEIVNDIEYLLFVEHEEDMKNYQHLKPIVNDLAALVELVSKKAVIDSQFEMTQRIVERVKETIGDIVIDSRTEKHNDW